MPSKLVFPENVDFGQTLGKIVRVWRRSWSDHRALGMESQRSLTQRIKNTAKVAMKKNTLLWWSYNNYFRLHNGVTLALRKPYLAASLGLAMPEHGSASQTSEPTLERVTSQLATVGQCFERRYLAWCAEMRSPARMNRKQWEFIFILEALRQHGMLVGGKRGLGFGCGTEPLPAMMAKRDCQVVATDQGLEDAVEQGWAQAMQHTAALNDLNPWRLCPPEQFARQVSFQTADMNAIPSELRGFDFLWSSCALEHLGSLEHGLRFVENAMQCLKPGGLAVHTTEFNLTSNQETLDARGLCIYRRQDIDRFGERLRAIGHELLPCNWNPGTHRMDQHVDLPPYRSSPHLKIHLDRYICTSIGLIIRKSR